MSEEPGSFGAAPPAPLAPYTIALPVRQTVPAIFASPHSGRDYPAAFVAQSRLDATMLRRSEDAHVDELFAAMPGLGAPLLAARFPRAFCDANRAPDELDQSVFTEPVPQTANARSARVAAGLGVIARVVRDGADIYPGKLPLAEARRRIDTLYAPYHAALAGLIAATRDRFGIAIVVDCHSMPGQLPQLQGHRGPAPDIVLGDRYGSSAAPAITEAMEGALNAEGFATARNNPYAGGYTVEHYGAPNRSIHALQIEISRRLYLDEDRVEKRTGAFDLLQRRLTAAMERFLGGLRSA
jgi:N-formylglutamate amidohydrolase